RRAAAVRVPAEDLSATLAVAAAVVAAAAGQHCAYRHRHDYQSAGPAHPEPQPISAMERVNPTRAGPSSRPGPMRSDEFRPNRRSTLPAGAGRAPETTEVGDGRHLSGRVGRVPGGARPAVAER